MNTNYKFNLRLVFYIVLTNLSLQSCNGILNHLTPQEERDITTQLVVQKLTSEGWEIESLYNNDRLNVRARERSGNCYSKWYDLPIYVTGDVDLEAVSNLDLQMQIRRVYLHLGQDRQPIHIVIARGGLIG